MEIKPIARIHNSFKSKFGIPRQSGLAESVESRIVFEPEYRSNDAVRGLNEFTYIWLIWQFSESAEYDRRLTVRPPRLGGNTRMGVFATRSPFRPNPFGLSSVKLSRIDFDCKDAPVLFVTGADLLDQTPIFDIKPYLRYADLHMDANDGFAATKVSVLEVKISDELLNLIPKVDRDAIVELLACDPRPGYQDLPDRIYGMTYGESNIKFKVSGNRLMVIDVDLN